MSTQDRDRRRARKAEPAPKSTAPEVVYTRPRPFQRKRFLLHLVTVFAVVLAVFLGISVFFKVDTVMVAGAKQYTADTVLEASGLQNGDSLLFFGRGKISGKILSNLPYVKSVRFGVTLPGTVTIIIEEVPVVYAIQAENGNWWLISSDGRITEKTDAVTANDCTRILGVKLKDPQVGEMAVAYEDSRQPEADAPVVHLASDRLAAGLAIAKQLEASEVFGKVTSVDVTKLQELEMWYGTQFQVKLGSLERMDYKIACVKGTVQSMGSHRSGVLDASFTTSSDGIIYQPFKN